MAKGDNNKNDKPQKLHWQSKEPLKQRCEEDLAKHRHWRRQAHSYKIRKGYVRDLWIYSGALIIFMPLSLQVFCLAALAFLSLSILDGEADAVDSDGPD